jgi:replicative DNA helicase
VIENAPPVAAVEAEQALVGAMLIAREPLELLAFLREDTDLTLPALQLIVGAIRRLIAAGSPVDFVTVLGELRRTGETVTAAGQTDVGLLLVQYAEAAPVPLSARWYGIAVLEAALRRSVLAYGTRLAQRASSADLADLLETVETDLSAIRAIRSRLDALTAAA